MAAGVRRRLGVHAPVQVQHPLEQARCPVLQGQQAKRQKIRAFAGRGPGGLLADAIAVLKGLDRRHLALAHGALDQEP